MEDLKDFMSKGWSYRKTPSVTLTEEDKQEIADQVSSLIINTEIIDNIAVIKTQEVSE